MTTFVVARCCFRWLRHMLQSPCLCSSRGIIGSLADDSDICLARRAKLPPLSSENRLQMLLIHEMRDFHRLLWLTEPLGFLWKLHINLARSLS